MRLRLMACLLLLSWISAFPAVFAGEGKARVLTAADREQAVTLITDTLEEKYVFPAVADKMKAHVTKRLKKGAYDTLTNPSAFAETLTNDLREICKDKHLRVRFQAGPRKVRQQEEPDRDEIFARMSERNFGFQEIKRLPGNIGYLDLRGFFDAEYAAPTAIAAMNFLAHTDALIIDLRRNGGGSPNMIQLMTSYFFQDSVHLNSFYIREGDKTEQYWTQSHVQGPKMTDTDIYILTGPRTFSAAEEFSYNLKHKQRATLVGETTGGGAHPVRGHYFDEIPFSMSIPFGRAINPDTGTNWEGTGVKPHIEVPAREALDRAYEAALKKLLDRGDQNLAQRIERDINILGYQHMAISDFDAAIETFKQNVALFPESANVYDSLGEAYMKAGNKAEAVRNYRKALDMDPTNVNASKMLERLGSSS